MARSVDKDAKGILKLKKQKKKKQKNNYLFSALILFLVLNLHEELGALKLQLDPTEWEKLKFVKRVQYPLNCNWKVYVENYCDGGYLILYFIFYILYFIFHIFFVSPLYFLRDLPYISR